MPQIGKMEFLETTDTETGEVSKFWAGRTDIKELRQFRAVTNERAQSDNAPSHVIMQGAREMGAMWKEGPDRNGNEYFTLKFNGYPLRHEIWMRAFKEEDGTFNLDYSAPRKSSAGEAA